MCRGFVVLLSLASLAAVSAALSPGSLRVTAVAGHQRHGAVIMKGRAQGGGPAKSKFGHKRKKLSVRLDHIRVEKEAAKKKRRPRPQRVVSAKRQWDRHKALVGGGQSPWAVFARAEGGGEWLPVGNVSFAEGDAAQAAATHKRLILEHAVRLYPQLYPQRHSLQAAVEASQGSGGATAAALEPQPQPQQPALCGFVGREDVASGYYCTRPSGVAAHVGDRDLKSKVKLSGIGLDSKSAVAIQFSESLDLRGH